MVERVCRNCYWFRTIDPEKKVGICWLDVKHRSKRGDDTCPLWTHPGGKM